MDPGGEGRGRGVLLTFLLPSTLPSLLGIGRTYLNRRVAIDSFFAYLHLANQFLLEMMFRALALHGHAPTGTGAGALLLRAHDEDDNNGRTMDLGSGGERGGATTSSSSSSSSSAAAIAGVVREYLSIAILLSASFGSGPLGRAHLVGLAAGTLLFHHELLPRVLGDAGTLEGGDLGRLSEVRGGLPVPACACRWISQPGLHDPPW
jgi:hypothetical protein